MKTRIGLIVGLVVLGCRGDEPPPVTTSAVSAVMQSVEFERACASLPTCAEPRNPLEGPTESVWRIQVIRRASGEIGFGRIESVEVAEGIGVPLGPRTGEYILVGLDGSGDPVDGQLIQFPVVARLEYSGFAAPSEELDLAGSEVSSIGYVRAAPSIETVALLEESGEIVVSVPLSSVRAGMSRSGGPFGLGFATPALAATPARPFSRNCPHVLILGADDEDLMGATPLGFDIDLVTPQPQQLANILAGLGRMTRLLCQSVSRIAFGKFIWTEGAAGQALQVGAWGDMMLINEDAGYAEAQLTGSGSAPTFRRLDLQHTVLHEAGHLAEALLNSEGKSLRGMAYGGHWMGGQRAVAKETIERVRLAKGFAEEWRRVHDSYVSLDWARGYTWIDDPYEWPPAQVAEGGFISPYAATNLADDIAETVAWTYMGHEYATAGVGNRRRDYACIQMQLHADKSLPARLAAVYTKLHFVKDLGLVTPQDVEQCTGVNIGIAVSSEGFEVWQGGDKKRSFASNVSAGIGTKMTGTKVFKMEAEGGASFGEANYPATMTLHLDLHAAFEGIDMVPWPRGAYELGSFFDGSQLMLRLDGAAAGNIDSEEGYAVVVEASNERIVGSVFMTQALRPSTPSPLPVYQNFDPPLVVRFLMEK